VRDCRQEVEPARRLSARWCPVEAEFQGSKVRRVEGGAGGMVGWGARIVPGCGEDGGCGHWSVKKRRVWGAGLEGSAAR